MVYLYKIANGIYCSYKDELESSNYKEHLPQHIVILFQDFKRAYDNRNINNLSNRISNSFSGDVYGKDKDSFIKLMNSIFNRFNFLLSPQLRIQVDGISENNDNNFVCILEMDAKFKLLNIPLPLNFDQGKLICEAKPEGKLNYWRITKIQLFKSTAKSRMNYPTEN